MSIDKKLLPDTWSVVNDGADSVLIDNTNGEELIENACFAEAYIQKDVKAKNDSQSFSRIINDESYAAAKEAKGYDFERLGERSLKMNINGTTEELLFEYGRYYRPEYPNDTDKDSYVLRKVLPRDGVYAEIIASCTKNELSEATNTLSSIHLKY